MSYLLCVSRQYDHTIGHHSFRLATKVPTRRGAFFHRDGIISRVFCTTPSTRARVFNAVRKDFERLLVAACIVHAVPGHESRIAIGVPMHVRDGDFEFVYSFRELGYVARTSLYTALKETLHVHKNESIVARRNLPADKLLTRALRVRGCCHTDAQGWLYDMTQTSLRLSDFVTGTQRDAV